MSKIGRYSHVVKLGSGIVTPEAYELQARLHAKLRERNKAIDRTAEKKKKQWTFHPPDPMNLFLIRDCGVVPAGLVISVDQRVGALLLSRRAAHIFASDGANSDVELAGTHEELCEALGI
jgi:hypothetical protein